MRVCTHAFGQLHAHCKDKSKEQKDELEKLWLLKGPIEQSETDVRQLKEQLGAISTLCESQNQSIKKSFERSIEENVTTRYCPMEEFSTATSIKNIIAKSPAIFFANIFF